MILLLCPHVFPIPMKFLIVNFLGFFDAVLKFDPLILSPELNANILHFLDRNRGLWLLVSPESC